MAKQDDFAKFQVRVPQPLRDALEAAAEDSGRSINAELVKRLEDSFSPLDRLIVEVRGADNVDYDDIARLAKMTLSMQRQAVERIEFRFVTEAVLDRLGIGVDDATPLPSELD